MIITVTSARQTEDDLVGVSAVEVNRDHPQSGQCQRLDGDQHELLPGSWMISRGVPRRMWRATMIVYPIPVGLFSRGRSPGVDRCRRRTGPLAEGSGERHRQRWRLGRTFLLGVDHLRGDDGSC